MTSGVEAVVHGFRVSLGLRSRPVLRKQTRMSQGSESSEENGRECILRNYTAVKVIPDRKHSKQSLDLDEKGT